ncbi:hypothetical protein BH09BAC3_BH09BAC3_08040 [soil metagenome]
MPLNVKTMNKRLLLLIVILVAAFNANSNNIAVTNVSLVNQSVAGPLASHFTFVKFDLSWDNSFRIAAGPANWDAAWVFVKFQVTGGAGCTASTAWNPATINTTGHSGPASIDGVSDTRGVFIYRSANGTGTNTFTNFQLRWNYPTDGLLDACSVTIKVFAIEMVHVPTGAFYLGDGVIGAPGAGRFEATPYGAGNIFQVTSSTTPSILGGGGAGSLGNNNTAGQVQLDDFNTVSAQVLSGTYPNGFAKFYVMKYEVGQEQYAEFLNTLTGTQQAQRTPATTAGWFHGAGGGIVSPVNRNGVKCISPPSGATPGQYASDLNNNGTVNEVAGDGRYLAMNFLSSPDLLAYLDWSGLRPMTELELEKACRGALLPVPGEFANGAAAVTQANALSNGGADNELSTTAGSNINYNNGLGGPARAGISPPVFRRVLRQVQAGTVSWNFPETFGKMPSALVT